MEGPAKEAKHVTEAVYPRLLHAGDTCVVVEFGDTIDMAVNSRMQALKERLSRSGLSCIRELIPTYRSVAVYFDPDAVDPKRFLNMLEEMSRSEGTSSAERATGVVIPVCYGGEFGPDMANVAAHTGLTEDEIVRRHAGTDCYCYMLGFTPGFAYLGGMDETLATPRLKEPREKIPTGSVGVAGKQTGIYPIESPGGWQLIGRTPLRMFDPRRSAPTVIEAGMWVRFRPVDHAEYDRLAALANKGDVVVERFTRESRPEERKRT